jgi:transcription elongation factor/antiterminator RfaH
MENTQSAVQSSKESMQDVNFQTRSVNWYALRTKPRHEKMAAAMLAHKGYESLLPLYQSRRPRPGRSRAVELPMFPGYLFCQFDVNARLPILTTPGVLQVVGLGRTPIPVKDAEIHAIRRLVSSPLHAEPWPFVEVGQTVYVQEGPLQGVEGVLLAFKNSHRLVLSVTLLQRSVAVEIERASVVPTPARPVRMAD